VHLHLTDIDTQLRASRGSMHAVVNIEAKQQTRLRSVVQYEYVVASADHDLHNRESIRVHTSLQ
jgi:hypothetical protein